MKIFNFWLKLYAYKSLQLIFITGLLIPIIFYTFIYNKNIIEAYKTVGM